MEKIVNISDNQDSNPAHDKKQNPKAVAFQEKNKLEVITETYDQPQQFADNNFEYGNDNYGASEKSCPVCTVLNPIEATKCYLCEQKLD